MSNLRTHAERELDAFGYVVENNADSMNNMMRDNVLKLIDVFAAQGHSGFSAPHCVALFKKLASFEPLCPLTGEESEWQKVAAGTFQNRRCSRVFKDASGSAYDIDGKVFREPNGQCYTNFDSRVPVIFPYTPKQEYVDVPSRP